MSAIQKEEEEEGETTDFQRPRYSPSFRACVCVGRPVCRSSVSITQGACSCRTTLDDLEPSPSFDSAIRLHPRTTRLAAREYLLPTNRPSPIRRIRMGEEARKFVFQSDLNKYSYSSTICNILFVKDNISEKKFSSVVRRVPFFLHDYLFSFDRR